MRKAFICPTKYVQGEDELLNLGYFVSTYGKTALLIAHPDDIARVQDKLDKTAEKLEPTISILPCCGMVSAENAEDEKFLEQAKRRDSRWVKIFATGGVGASPEKVLTPTMKKDVFLKLVREYHAAGKLVMVHTWGGDSFPANCANATGSRNQG